MTGPIGEPETIWTLRKRLKNLSEKIDELEAWAKERRNAENKNRPKENINREILHITWTQVINKIDELFN
jgi:predicted RNA-binding protein